MPEGTVQLKTQADLPSAEIAVFDANLQFVHRAVGSLDIMLAPGVYTVQYRAGSAVADVPVALRPGSEPVTLAAPRLQMKSPAPLAGSTAGDLYGDIAKECSSSVHEKLGLGGELFIFARLATSDTKAIATLDNRLSNIAVLDASGTQIANLRQSPRRAADGTSVGYNLALDPGTYLLRFDPGEGSTLEQSVVVCEGWQTQVLASSRGFGLDRRVVGPNLPEAAVFVVRQGAGYQPSAQEAAWAESARQGLAQGGVLAPEQHLRNAVAECSRIRESVPAEHVQEMLKSKFGNPMLGVYGAHLLLLAPEKDWELLREVVRNLKTLIGGHPDVTALTLLPQLNDLRETAAYPAPPMLKSSWNLILAQSTAQPELVPPGSYSERIASRLWGSNAWLVWRSPSLHSRPESAPAMAAESAAGPTATMDIESAVAILREFVSTRTSETHVLSFVTDLVKNRSLNDAERAILVYFATGTSHARELSAAMRFHSGVINRALDFAQDAIANIGLSRRSAFSLSSDAAMASESELSYDRLVRALGMPAGSLKRGIVSLAKKVSSAAG